MAFSVTLEKQLTATDPATQPEPIKVILKVTSFDGIPDAGVFLFHVDTVTGVPAFETVSSVVDYNEFFLNVISDNTHVRKNEVEKVFETSETAEEFITSVEGGIQTLVDDFKRIDDFDPPVTVVISA